MHQRLVPATLIPGILDLAIKNRIAVEKIFAHAKVDPSLIGNSGAFITFEQMIRLFNAAYSALNDPAFGIRLGESVQYHSLDLLGHLVATSRNLAEALEELFQFKDLVAPFTAFALELKGRHAVLSFTIDPLLIRKYLPLHQDLVAVTLVTIGNAITEGGLRLKEVRFTHARPAYAQEYDRVLRAPVLFGCPRNELVIDREQLQESLLTSYPAYHSRMQALARERLRSLEQGQSLESKVASYISKNMGVQPTPLEDVASHFNMTPRTLQRRLKQEATSFVALRDQCRHARALRDLGDPAVDIERLSDLLGFSDTSNFYHAFKRWEGVSPGSYRRRALEQGQSLSRVAK